MKIIKKLIYANKIRVVLVKKYIGIQKSLHRLIKDGPTSKLRLKSSVVRLDIWWRYNLQIYDRRNDFLHHLVTGDIKWIRYDNLKKRRSRGQNYSPVYSWSKPTWNPQLESASDYHLFQWMTHGTSHLMKIPTIGSIPGIQKDRRK